MLSGLESFYLYTDCPASQHISQSKYPPSSGIRAEFSTFYLAEEWLMIVISVLLRSGDVVSLAGLGCPAVGVGGVDGAWLVLDGNPYEVFKIFAGVALQIPLG